jgi:hypothetical protein
MRLSYILNRGLCIKSSGDINTGSRICNATAAFHEAQSQSSATAALHEAQSQSSLLWLPTLPETGSLRLSHFPLRNMLAIW